MRSRQPKSVQIDVVPWYSERLSPCGLGDYLPCRLQPYSERLNLLS